VTPDQERPGRDEGALLIAEEQAALRRVAAMVARGAAPQEVFDAVTGESGRVLGTDFSILTRYDDDGTVTVVASWSNGRPPFPIGIRRGLGGRNVHTLIHQTGEAVRIDDYSDTSGGAGNLGREFGLRSSAGAPIRVEGRLWGTMNVSSATQRLPDGIEDRLAAFIELAATAIANAQARAELRGFADEQAALRRVAVLVGRGATLEEVLAAVAEQAGRLFDVHHAAVSRYGIDGMRTVVATWSSVGTALRVGLRAPLSGENMHTMVLRTGRAARIDDYGAASGKSADDARDMGIRAAVGVPISVEGELWGVMYLGSTQEPLPPGTEQRLEAFTELAATAIANAEARAELAASRARIVAAADAARRRIERNLHDGAQQRLVLLALQLRDARSTLPPGTDEELTSRLDQAIDETLRAHEELRDIAHGLHPSILSEGGLQFALRALARESAVPVSLDVQVDGRLPDPIEIAAYYTVAEALTNTAKHAQATAAEVTARTGDGLLRVRISDDGRGGARFGSGTGLTGLKDRVEALGGQISLDSAPEAGTTLDITLPV
jgi:signal transduction histidine kinase